MRTSIVSKFLFAIVAFAAFVACEADGPATQPKPSIILKEVSKSETTLTFSLTTKNAEEAKWLCVEQGSQSVDADYIAANGALATTEQIVVENLTPDTDYEIYAIAVAGEQRVMAESIAMRTEPRQGAPEDYLEFIPDPATQEVFRRAAYSGEKPGEYIFEFTDKDWGALVLDVYADATACDNGYAAIPEGTYTIADGTVDPYSNVTFYEPENISMSFVECTATISRSGDDYTFVIDAMCDDANATKVWMEYTGPVKDMERQAVVPTIALAEVAKDATSFTFSITTTDAVELKWLYIEKGARTVNMDQVFSNGTAADVNTTAEIVIENLEMDTEYEVYAAVKGDKESVMAEPLAFKTDYVAQEYIFNPTQANSPSYAAGNFYIAFDNDDMSESFSLDIYVDPSNTYLPSGVYELGEAEEGFTSVRYTRYTNGTDIDNLSFASGSVEVVAAPNEETREIIYTFNGTFFYESGDSIVLSYEGVVNGLSLPSADVPEGYMPFVPDPETQAVFRRAAYSAEKPGEYIFEFTDKDWGALVLDIYADAAACDNGKAAIPEGTYTIADGTVDTYSNVLFYEPSYMYMNFVECTVTITRSGDDYSFTVDALCDDANATKVWMTYTGPVAGMVRE